MIWTSFAFFQNRSVKIRLDTLSLELFLLRSLLNSHYSFVVHIIFQVNFVEFRDSRNFMFFEATGVW